MGTYIGKNLTEKEVDDALARVEGSWAIEGFESTPEERAILRQFFLGELSEEQIFELFLTIP